MQVQGRMIPAGLGELQVSGDPKAVLVAYGLGSCVGVVAYEPVVRVGAILHAMLPHASASSEGPLTKFVDTGIKFMLKEVERCGGKRDRLIVKIVGGARMLLSPDFRDIFDIGACNAQMAQHVLADFGLALNGTDVGGSQGRTVRLYVATGKVVVKTLGEEKEL